MKRQTGYTLIEVMIVVAIIGILAAIVYPSYKESTKKAHRSDAQQLMMDIANKQQQYLMDARAYATDLSALNISRDGWTCGATCTTSFYTVSIMGSPDTDNSATPPKFKIQADATGTQVSDGDLFLDSTGSRTSENGHENWGG